MGEGRAKQVQKWSKIAVNAVHICRTVVLVEDALGVRVEHLFEPAGASGLPEQPLLAAEPVEQPAGLPRLIDRLLVRVRREEHLDREMTRMKRGMPITAPDRTHRSARQTAMGAHVAHAPRGVRGVAWRRAPRARTSPTVMSK